MEQIEDERLAAFERQGIKRRLAATSPSSLPVVLDSARAMFVYVDPGHDTSPALRSWGNAHRGLWCAPMRLGRSVEVVAAACTSREIDQAEGGVSAEADAGTHDESARIEQRSLEGAVRVLEEFGGLQAPMNRTVALTKQIRRQGGRGSSHRGTTWQTVRLDGSRYR
ncbi:MAG: hypothetical protein OXQ94_14840 [Gemmatimonadota bacterium]|nr:hypothetical protein [Gemmatimonadota bacterium]